MGIKIYTSYYAQGKKLAAANVLRVGISVGLPRFGGFDKAFKVLAPTREMVHNEETEYVPKFNAILAELDPASIVDELEHMAREAGKTEVAIMCYEKVGDFCHRNLVADWLNTNKEETKLTYDIVEWGQAPKRQKTLFEQIDDI